MSAEGGVAADVVHVLPAKVGGVMSTVASLVRHRPPGAMPQGEVLTRNRLDRDTATNAGLGADWQAVVDLSLPLENLSAVLARLARAIPGGEGVLVANDWLELAMLARHDPGRAVVQVVHGDYDYYYRLAEDHAPVVDAFVGCSRHIVAQLQARLPHRSADIHYLPHGVELPATVRTAAPGPLRLLFVGRLDEAKGVHDLPAVDRELASRGVDARWTIVGDGPERDALRAAWPAGPRIAHLGTLPREQVLELARAHDVLVLPTRAEGFPVVVLEAMAAGVVPVVSDLPSGIPEMVLPGDTGMRVPVGGIGGFASAIAALAADRALLERLSAGARRRVEAEFDVRDRVRDYHALFGRWRELRASRPRGTITVRHGSRLDQPWLPNALVYAVRSAARRLRRR